MVKNRGPIRKPPSRFVRNLGSVDFGEKESRIHHYRQHHLHHSSATGATVINATSAAGSSGNNGFSSSLDQQQKLREIPTSHQEEDESVISVDQSNDEDAILV